MVRAGSFGAAILPGHGPGFVYDAIELFGFVGQPNVFVSLAAGNDAIVEGNVGLAAAQLAHFKAVGGFIGDIEALAVSLWA